jgi:branched-subunit amino acid transport protein
VSEPLSGPALAVVTAGLALATFVTRTSFLLAGARLRLSPRIEAALRYAPVCTLCALIVPDVLLHAPGGTLDLAATNPRLVGVAAAAAWLCFSRHIVGCLATGMAAYTLARLYL